MNTTELKKYILSDQPDELLKKIIGCDDLEAEKKRYITLIDEALERYGDGDYHFISSPGRSEIGGNHTDHQHGNVVAASLNMDNLVIVKANGSNIVNYRDGDYVIAGLDISSLDPRADEINSSKSLVRGIAARLEQLGYKYGGFDALCNSRVLVGSGISSSACFEVMLVEIFNLLFNDEAISDVERAKIGQYAENVYFGKPSGLLDQMAISVGGFVAIDFKNPDDPAIENYDFSFTDHGYQFFLVDTKGDHSDLSHEYAAVTEEIKEVAKVLGVKYLADSPREKFFDNFASIREKVKNDRAMLRASHFYYENERAIKEKEAIRDDDIAELLKLMKKSGRSSFEYLQNVYPVSRVNSQSLSIGLSLADNYLDGQGAYRVHGGGFEGTIQVIVPDELADGFKATMTAVFGEDCLMPVKIRPFGTITVI